MDSEKKLGTAELLFNCAQQMGMDPVWVIYLDTFVVNINGSERYINMARSPLNSASSVALAKNKYLTRCILERHKLQNIPYTRPVSLIEAELFLGQHKTIIAKPVSGSGAHDIHIITEPAQLKNLMIKGYILEKYILGKEIRYLILNGRVIGVHRSDYGTSVKEDRPLQRISYPRAMWKRSLIDSSLHIAELLSLRFAAVDFMINDSGEAYVLEVNTMPGLKWFHAPTRGPIVDVARLFLESIVKESRYEKAVTPEKLVSGSVEVYS